MRACLDPIRRCIGVRAADVGLYLLVAGFAFGTGPAMLEGTLDLGWVPHGARLSLTSVLFMLANVSSLWPRPSDARRRAVGWLVVPAAYLLVTYAGFAIATTRSQHLLLASGWPVWMSALVVAADTLRCAPLQDSAIHRRLTRAGCTLWGWGLVAGASPHMYYGGGIYRSAAWDSRLAVVGPLEERIFFSCLAVGVVALGASLLRRKVGPSLALLALFAATGSSDAMALFAAHHLFQFDLDAGALLDALAWSSRVVALLLLGVTSAALAWSLLAHVVPGARAKRWRSALALLPLLAVSGVPPSLDDPTDRAKQRPEPVWELAGVDAAMLPHVRGWPPTFRFHEELELPAALDVDGALHLFGPRGRVVLHEGARVSSRASLTAVFDQRATVGDLRRAARTVDVERIDLAFLATTLSDHRAATERWPFVAMASRTLLARSVFLERAPVPCRAAEGGPAPFSCCTRDGPTQAPHRTVWGPRLRIEAPDDLRLTDLLEAASGSDGSFELIVPRADEHVAVPWEGAEPLDVPMYQERSDMLAAVGIGALVALCVVAASLGRDLRGHRALRRGTRGAPSTGDQAIRIPGWLSPHDTDEAVVPDGQGPYRQGQASSIVTTSSLGRALCHGMVRRSRSFGRAALRTVLLGAVSAGVGLAAHRIVTPWAPGDQIIRVYGHESYGSACDGRIGSGRYRGPGRCCEWP